MELKKTQELKKADFVLFFKELYRANHSGCLAKKFKIRDLFKISDKPQTGEKG
jgi:hypothetical protein